MGKRQREPPPDGANSAQSQKRQKMPYKMSPIWTAGFRALGEQHPLVNNQNGQWTREPLSWTSCVTTSGVTRIPEQFKPVQQVQSNVVGQQVTRSWKIEIAPTLEQKRLIRQWIGVTRTTYNRALDANRQNKLLPRQQRRKENDIKNEIVSESLQTPQFLQQNQWYFDAPRAIRDAVYKQYQESVTSSFASAAALNTHTNGPKKFRTRRDLEQSMKISPSGGKNEYSMILNKEGFLFYFHDPERKYKKQERVSGVKANYLLKSPLKPKNYKDYERFKYVIDKQDDIVHFKDGALGYYIMADLKWYTRSDRYFLSIPYVIKKELPAPPSSTEAQRAARIIALDPNVRTMLTGYCPNDGSIIDFAPQAIQRINRLCKHMDNFISKIAKHKKNYHGPKMRQQRLRMRRALQKQRQRIKNLVDDMHKKLCRELINEYDVILLPEFRTSEMVLRATRKIDNKTARNMLTLKHYQFRQRLLNLSAHPSCQTRVHICTEEYTTQTCGHCGWQHANIGGNKRFNCSHCNLRADRDHNAARNIYLLNAPKYVTNLQIPKPLVPLRSS